MSVRKARDIGEGRIGGRTLVALAMLATAALTGTRAEAQETNSVSAAPAVAAKPDKGPPLPLHQIEGNGGIFATLSAYIVNPPRDGEALGRPAVGFSFVDLGHGQNLEALTATESPWKRLELGYGYNRLDLGDLPLDVRNTAGASIQQEVSLHNFNGRVNFLKEGEFDQKWLPAVTFGTHFKYNADHDALNHQLGGALSASGITDKSGTDFTLYASKMLTFLPRPVLVELGGRATEGVWNGLAGFTDSYSYLFEGNVVVFVTSNIALAAEYRQQPNDYKPIVVGGKSLVRESGDWWTLDAAYVVNNHFTVAVGYGHFGGVLNHDANSVWGVTTKYEF